MMLLQIDKKSKIFFYLLILIFLSTINNFSISKIGQLTSKIKFIEVTGADENFNLKIKKNLFFLINENIFFLKKRDIKRELEKYNYLESYRVLKIFPSKIIIHIKHASLLGITVRNNKKYYIGSNSKLIDFKDVDKQNYLPNVFGGFSTKDFLLLKKKINKTNFNNKIIKDYFFFPNKRWDLKTTDDLTIKLPKDNVENSLEKAIKIIENSKFNQYKIIDLRMPNQVILY